MAERDYKLVFLGAESLGVRSFCFYLEYQDLKLLVDPGVALAPFRCNLTPHPIEFLNSFYVRKKIERYASIANTIVITHYHKDHYTPPENFIYGWVRKEDVKKFYKNKELLMKSFHSDINHSQKVRAQDLKNALSDLNIIEADGYRNEVIKISPPFPHGEDNTKLGFVTMLTVNLGEKKLLYASDTQLISTRVVDYILSEKPNILISSAPPLYLNIVDSKSKKQGLEHLRLLAKSIPHFIIDHHLLRDLEGVKILGEIKELAEKHGNKVQTSAEFVGKENKFLEAKRSLLYNEFPLKSKAKVEDNDLTVGI